jgi:flagellum-specific peptidoglycan hydrolase FlgJ
MASQQRKDFIAKIAPLIRLSCAGSTVLPSVRIAQMCIESADGKSDLARNANNYFGVKCGGSWNGLKYYSKDDCGAQKCCFRHYASMQISIDEQRKLLNQSRYAKVRAATTYKEQAKQLKACGYATAIDYANNIIGVIQTYNLTQYDIAYQNGENDTDTDEDLQHISNVSYMEYLKNTKNLTYIGGALFLLIIIAVSVGSYRAGSVQRLLKIT